MWSNLPTWAFTVRSPRVTSSWLRKPSVAPVPYLIAKAVPENQSIMNPQAHQFHQQSKMSTKSLVPMYSLISEHHLKQQISFNKKYKESIGRVCVHLSKNYTHLINQGQPGTTATKLCQTTESRWGVTIYDKKIDQSSNPNHIPQQIRRTHKFCKLWPSFRELNDGYLVFTIFLVCFWLARLVLVVEVASKLKKKTGKNWIKFLTFSQNC